MKWVAVEVLGASIPANCMKFRSGSNGNTPGPKNKLCFSIFLSCLPVRVPKMPNIKFYQQQIIISKKNISSNTNVSIPGPKSWYSWCLPENGPLNTADNNCIRDEEQTTCPSSRGPKASPARRKNERTREPLVLRRQFLLNSADPPR